MARKKQPRSGKRSLIDVALFAGILVFGLLGYAIAICGVVVNLQVREAVVTSERRADALEDFIEGYMRTKGKGMQNAYRCTLREGY